MNSENSSRTPSPGEPPIRPQSAHAPPGVSNDERRRMHLQNIRDLGSRAEQCWVEYRESEIMKCRCELVHWQSRQKALESEVVYAAEIVSRKTDILHELEKNYGEIKRQPQPVPVHGPRTGVQAEEVAAVYPAPVTAYGDIRFNQPVAHAVPPRVFKFNHHGSKLID